MNIAKPPGGFEVVLAPPVQAFVDNLFRDDPSLQRYWRPVMARLRDAGHRAGGAMPGKPGQRFATFQAAPDAPRIKLAWHVMGDRVTVVLADL